MAQSGYTPIQHYRTSTASAVPTAGNLADGEFALNLTDEKLYFKNASGVVKLLASSGGASGSVTSVDASGGTTGLAFSGGPITSSGTLTLGGTLNVASGGTGAASFTSGYLLRGNGTSALTASAVYESGGNVGIGTATPAQRLDVFDGCIRVGGADQGKLLGYSASNALVMDLGVSTGTGIGSDIGLYNLLSGNLTLGTNSTERMRISGAGDVGIGTSSPVYKLHVAGDTYASSQIISGTAGTATIGLTFGGQTTKTGIGCPADGTLSFYAGGPSERMRIDSSGNVGIGTSTPSEKLVVSGNAIVTGGASFRGVSELGGTLNTGYAVTTTDCVFEHGALRSGDGNTYIDLHATSGTDYESRIIRAGGLNGSLEISNKGTGALSINAEGAAYIRLATSNSERMRVGPSGNVGIGTSSPATLLDVAGTVTATSFIGAGTGLSGTAAGLTAGSVSNAITFATTGGAAAGTTFNGSAARVVDYSTVGAPKADGTGASGTWGINISGNAATVSSVTSGQITGALGYTPVQQGGGTGQSTNKVYIGWLGTSQLGLQIDATNFGSVWPISVSGNAATATSATTATSASSAANATNAANLVTSNYSIVESGGYVYIKYGSTNICRIDSSGNAVFRGNVTGNDTSI